MAVTNEDLARLVVTLEATTTKYYNALRKAQQQTNTSASSIEKRLSDMSSRVDKTFANLGQRMSHSLSAPLAGVGAFLGVREITRYADAWTEAGNKVAAAGSIVGVQGRSLEQLRELADEGRASFEDTIQLYSRMLRAAGDVASSELEVARATNIVNKAFKAGGASTAEMQAGVIQLSQGLASGLLQGDELRSIRENAPVLAEAMAKFFGTTIGGLKELGSQGKLTSDLVFKAILSGETQIEAAFATTNRTIGEGFQLVQNRLIQYIGSADQSLGATAALNIGLTALADNFSFVADNVLKLAALIAGALVGRSMVAMIGAAGDGIVALRTLSATFADLRKNGASFGQIAGTVFGPLALIVGGAAALAFQTLAAQSLEASTNIKSVNEQADELGAQFIESAKGIREAAVATDELTAANERLIASERLRNSQAAVKSNSDLRRGTFLDNLTATAPVFATSNAELQSAFAIASRASSMLFQGLASETDAFVTGELQRLAAGLRDSTIPAETVIARLRELNELNISKPVLELLDATDKIAISLENADFVNTMNGNSAAIENVNQELIETLRLNRDMLEISGEFALVDELDVLIEKLVENKIEAEDAGKELTRLAATNGTFGNFLPGLLSIISNVIGLKSAAEAAKAAMDDLAGGTNAAQDIRTFREADEGSMAPIRAGEEFLAEQERLLAMTEAERDLEEEIAKIRKEAGENAFLTEEQLAEKAQQRLAQAEADKKNGGGSKSDSEKFLETLEQQERTNELLAEEAAIRATLNPLVNDYGLTLEKWRKEQELLNAAEEAGIELTPGLREKIATIAEAYAAGQAAIERMEESQDKLKESMQEWADLAKSAARSFIDDLIAGKTAAEALGGVLEQLGSRLIDLGLNTLFGGGGGSGGLGIFGQLFDLPGRATGGPVRAGQPYIVGERRPEVFVPNQSGVIIPRVPNQMGASGSITTPISISIDAKGADSAGLARLQTELVKIKAELPYLVREQVSQKSKKGW